MLLTLLKSKYLSTPPTTRCLFTLISIISILHYTKHLKTSQTSFSPFHIIYRLEIYRLIIPFLNFSINTLDSVLSLFFCYKYCSMIEVTLQNQFSLILVSILILLNLLSIFWDINISASFSCAITYIWTRFNPSTQVALMGFVIFPSFYLPFVVPTLVFWLERKVPYDELAGILTGHIVYFCWVLLPKLRVFSMIRARVAESVSLSGDGALLTSENTERVVTNRMDSHGDSVEFISDSTEEKEKLLEEYKKGVNLDSKKKKNDISEEYTSETDTESFSDDPVEIEIESSDLTEDSEKPDMTKNTPTLSSNNITESVKKTKVFEESSEEEEFNK
ncbi:Derlin-2 [Cucumispora dikerogammari]|nr:Derlin-2 [Cucumispora dikerogammari]